jgi:hypothetical protein
VEEIIAQSQYDKTMVNNYEEFMIHLQASYLFLIERRNLIHERLAQFAQLKN